MALGSGSNLNNQAKKKSTPSKKSSVGVGSTPSKKLKIQSPLVQGNSEHNEGMLEEALEKDTVGLTMAGQNQATVHHIGSSCESDRPHALPTARTPAHGLPESNLTQKRNFTEFCESNTPASETNLTNGVINHEFMVNSTEIFRQFTRQGSIPLVPKNSQQPTPGWEISCEKINPRAVFAPDNFSEHGESKSTHSLRGGSLEQLADEVMAIDGKIPGENFEKDQLKEYKKKLFSKFGGEYNTSPSSTSFSEESDSELPDPVDTAKDRYPSQPRIGKRFDALSKANFDKKSGVLTDEE